MSDLNSFYEYILNLRQVNEKDKIRRIVLEEKENLLSQTNDMTGFCKFIASQIELRLREEDISTYWLDLNELIGVDHVVLIAEYRFQNEMKRMLIDPTYIQFTKKDNHQLIGFKEWPSERLDEVMLSDLLNDGVTDLDDNRFNNYLNSFKGGMEFISLNNYLLSQIMDTVKKR